MKFTRIAMTTATMTVMLGTGAWAAGRQKVTICMDKGEQWEVVNNATPIVSKLLVPAGFSLEWHSNGHCPNHAERIIRISFSTHTKPDLLPGALAYALPYEGEHIVVFYDRLERTDPGSPAILMAHVMAHEITHLLQGIPRHSEEGLMKARWDREDFARMKLQPLWFTEADLQLIREGVAAYQDLRARRIQVAESAPAAPALTR